MMVADQLRDFLENGNIRNSVNYPEAVLPRVPSTTRLAIANSNVPNMVGQISTCLAAREASTSRICSTSRAASTPIRSSTPMAPSARMCCGEDPRHRRRTVGAAGLSARRDGRQRRPRDGAGGAHGPRCPTARSSRPCARAIDVASIEQIHAPAQRARALAQLVGISKTPRRPHGRFLPPGARGAGAAHGARAQPRAAARRGGAAAVPRDHVGLPGAAGAAQSRLSRARGHLHPDRGAHAFRALGARAAAGLDRRGVPRGRGRQRRISASCRSRTPPKARSTTRSIAS